MSPLSSFFSSFFSYLLLVIVIVIIAGIAIFIGINLAKAKNRKASFQNNNAVTQNVAKDEKSDV